MYTLLYSNADCALFGIVQCFDHLCKASGSEDAC